MSLRSGRRRQHRVQSSVRWSVAAGLVATAAGIVALALVSGSPFAVAASAVLAVLGSVTALRIMRTEIAAQRRDHQRDRAALAGEYAALERRRSAETAAERADLVARLASRDRAVAGLEFALVEAHGRLDAAEDRTADLSVRLAELELELEVAHAEADALGAELTAWEAHASRRATA